METPEQPNEKHVAIPKADAQAILDYLASRPYAEVYKLIPGLQNSLEVIINQSPTHENG